MRYAVLVFLGACSYGILSTFVKIAYDRGFTVDEVSGSQMLLGVLLMWTVALIARRRGGAVAGGTPKQRPTVRETLLLLAVGCATGMTGMLYYNSLQHVPASVGILLLFQFTWMGVLLEALLTRTLPGKDKLLSLLLLLAGTVLAGNILSQGAASYPLKGVLLGLLAALTYTLFIVFSGRTATRLPSLTRSAIMTTGGALTVMLVYPPVFLTNGALLNGLLPFSLLLALFGAIIPTLFFAIGVPHIGGGLATILSAAELPTAVFMSGFVLREHVSGLQWIGVAVILAGIAYPEWRRMRALRNQVG
ncbi:EamA family transporter [Paenibacillus sp. J31TS4]|uniref:EamA family transporter n=1 Tax=Paenibacillus sp. J31TS4 TaxID=2807195 RepID=UPI001BCE7B98|nr:DMT family transporter [Paenibacillus sp. J31TS4]